MTNTIGARPADACPWCSTDLSWVMHTGKCPRVKAIEYHPSGTVKRVEFYEAKP